MMKHTPGPWAVFPFKHWFRITAENDNLAIADLWYGHEKHKPQAEIDARLIASAPELLAALKLCLPVLEKLIPFEHAFEREAHASTLAAIAKAEGGA